MKRQRGSGRAFTTADMREATTEMYRRASKWSGVWAVCKHPTKPDQLVVCLATLAPGEILKEYGTPLSAEGWK